MSIIDPMDITRVDLNLLPVFEALEQTHSVTRAAHRLGLSQSAMSAALGRLRSVLNDPLFVRGSRQMLPTPRARELSKPVHELLERMRREVFAAARFEPRTTDREFGLCLTDVGGAVFLPRLLCDLRRVAPRARLRSEQVAVGEIERALEEGRVDLALGNFPDLPGSVFQQRLYERSYACICRADHPNVGSRLTLRTYLQLEHAVVRSPVRVHEAIDRALGKRGARRKIALSVPHYLALPYVIEQTDFIATVPREIAEVFGRQAAIRIVNLPLPIPNVTLRQHWHKRYHHDAANRWLRERVARLFAEPER